MAEIFCARRVIAPARSYAWVYETGTAAWGRQQHARACIHPKLRQYSQLQLSLMDDLRRRQAERMVRFTGAAAFGKVCRSVAYALTLWPCLRRA